MSRMADGARGYENYRCRARHAAGVCSTPARISIARADQYVTDAFLAWIDVQRIRVQGSPAGDAIEQALARVESAEAELVAYRDANLISVIGSEVYRAGLSKRQRMLDQARVELDQARRSVPAVAVHDVPTLWPTLAAAERRTLLAAAIDAVVVRRATVRGKAAFSDRIGILWRGDAPTDLPGRRVKQLRPLAVPDDRPDPVGVASAHDR